MSNRIRTRFAPSPTGYMHIGNLRTALYGYLFAKSQGGDFILRIEDTDQERFVEGAREVINESLAAAHIIADESPEKGGAFGPYVQSERKAIYKEYAEKLVASGHAYRCFCSAKDHAHESESEKFGGYDRHCRDLAPEEIERQLAAGTPYVIRQKMPLTGSTTYRDLILGSITIENSELEDQILLKSDGMPTYNFANVVDDHLMEITHVIRGNEYITSTPKHVLLYEFFGWQLPEFIHLPPVMGKSEDGTVSKLSKRHGAASFGQLLDEGYLAEAVTNYVALLGWSPKDTNQEIFTMEELIGAFSLDGISKSPAIFDYKKLDWMNGEYFKAMEPAAFARDARPFAGDLPEELVGNGTISPRFCARASAATAKSPIRSASSSKCPTMISTAIRTSATRRTPKRRSRFCPKRSRCSKPSSRGSRTPSTPPSTPLSKSAARRRAPSCGPSASPFPAKK